MLRRNMQIPLNKLGCHKEEKQQNYSPSTDDSGSPRSGFTETYGKPSIRKDKEKSQLCKKYLEFGFCPYEKKCKFAHGSHELRKNQQFNSKYKTKECGVFLSEGYCMYGERCNFIHNKVICSKEIGFGDAGFQEVKAEGRLQSRLLSLLSLDSQ